MDITRTQSPQPSPHGAIGERPSKTSSHARSSSLAGAPRTPLGGKQSSDDDMDLPTLMSHGQRQLDLDRSRFGRFGIPPAPASAGAAPLRGRTGMGAESNDSPSRWAEEWRESTPRSRDTSMQRQVSSTGATSTSTLAFKDQGFPSPIGRRSFAAASTPSSSDPSVTATHHLNALSAVLNPLIAQSDEVIRLRAEVELWRGEWQRCDRERRRLEAIVSTEDPAKGRPKFTVALIDGDGLIFNDDHLRGGFMGGQAAARAFMTALPGLVAKASGTGNDSKPAGDLGQIIVQVFLNKSGLGHALVKAGCIPSWTVYDSFWHGFVAAHDLFNVVDVGHGKEASDSKIREHLKLYASDAQCNTVILGASHDNSYAPVIASLDTVLGLSKLVILQGYSDLAPQLRPYASRCVSLPELFRNSRVPALTKPAVMPIRATMAVPEENTDQAEVESTSSASPLATPDAEVDGLEWDKVAIGSRSRTRRNNGTVPVKTVSEDDMKKKKTAVRSINVPTVRNLKPRPCHTFYLSPWGCKNGDGCEYAHHYKLNDDQTEELSRLAKEIICPYVRSKRCHFREDECVYGHRCPRRDRCTFGDTCRFKDLPNGHGEEDAE